MKTKTKKTYQPLRWTLSQAASEFGLHPRMMAQRAKAAGLTPGADGRFSTADISRAVFGDLDKARLRKMQLEGDHAQLNLEKTKADYVDGIYERLAAWLAPLMFRIQQKVYSSSMPEAEQDAFLSELSQFSLELQEKQTAARQKQNEEHK